MRIGIAGAGIIGRLLALTCLERGHEVTIFDRGSLRNSFKDSGNLTCSEVAAGLLSPWAEIETTDSTIFELGNRSLDLWPQIIDLLEAPIFFQREGSLLLAHPADWPDCERFVKLAERKILGQSIQILNQHELNSFEPELDRFSKAAFLPLEGQIDPLAVLSALAEKLSSFGIQWRMNQTVTHMASHRIVAGGVEYLFDSVVDCRGLGAKEAFPNLRGVRGELLWIKAPEVTLHYPIRLMHPRYRIYIAPRPDKLFIVGASEIESEDYSPISVRSTLELLSGVYSLHPGFAEGRIIKSLVHCRPALPDNLPQILSKNGWIAVNGLYRHGYLLAPALVEKILELLEK